MGHRLGFTLIGVMVVLGILPPFVEATFCACRCAPCTSGDSNVVVVTRLDQIPPPPTTTPPTGEPAGGVFLLEKRRSA